MKIGVDFGTTYTKIAYLDENSKPVLFDYPKGNKAKKYIPTAVAYRQRTARQTGTIGTTARLDMLKKNSIFCDNFKMLLPLENSSQWEKQGWPANAPEPVKVVADYLNALLREDKRSFEHVHHPIQSLVVSVPEVWQREVDNRGAEQLKQIIQQQLRLQLDRLMSEPVCAAAYYAYQHEQEYGAFVGNVLVCDMGGGTFDVALCSIHGQKVNVLCFDGNGRRELGLAGVTFDHQAVTTAYHDLHQKEPDMSSREFLELLRDFEEEKVNRDVTDELDAIREYPEDAADTPLYTLSHHDDEYELTYARLQEAFLPILARAFRLC